VSWVDRTFLVWALGGLIAAFGLGWLFGGRLSDGLTGLLWGGAVRMLVVHHVTYSVDSLCHFFGRRRFDTGDGGQPLCHRSSPRPPGSGARPRYCSASVGMIARRL
jgi:stearoyl-CoA desaturase (delta-9 desaturase)